MRYLLYLITTAIAWTAWMVLSARMESEPSLGGAYCWMWALELLLSPAAAAVAYLVERGVDSL